MKVFKVHSVGLLPFQLRLPNCNQNKRVGEVSVSARNWLMVALIPMRMKGPSQILIERPTITAEMLDSDAIKVTYLRFLGSTEFFYPTGESDCGDITGVDT
jgi:hypothetical protein